MSDRITKLHGIAQKLRYDVVQMMGPGKAGHLGGSCSLAEIAAVLYFDQMRHDPKNPRMRERDRFLLSKGHSALIQYAALAEVGYFPLSELKTLKMFGSILQGHPDMRKTPGVEANTGSLGQGLSIAAGMAAAGKLDRLDYRVYCVMGDGELAEGQIWEAAMAASFYRLDNLIGIVDKNRLQATGRIVDRFNTNPISEKWAAFGWRVLECDGHDIPSVIRALEEARKPDGRPVVVVAETVKGKGISFAENVVGFHHGSMTGEQYERALLELGKGD